jgi:tagatose-6-phosphate ketose/aldose isomerase
LNLTESEKVNRGLAHTPAEIAQQPDTWLSTFELFRNRQAEIVRFLSSAGVSGAPPACNLTVFLAGAGTSDYIGHALTHLLRKLWQCDVIAVPSTDLLTHMDELMVPGRKYLWISFSRSGESPEGVAVLKSAWKHRPDIHHIVISCKQNGRMIIESANNPQVFAVCLSDAVNDRGLAMTGSFSN